MLARYSDPHGRLREVLARPGSRGSVLIVDRDASTHGDHRLVAHLGADEPPGNAALTCRDYLRNHHNRRCRPLAPEDLWVTPFAEDDFPDSAEERDALHTHDAHELRDCNNNSYRLLPFVEGIAIPALRWQRLPAPDGRGEPRALSMREVVATLESYEPVREITAHALARHRGDARLSISTLRGEHERMSVSPIVLNRGLREAVLRAIATEELSMSEIAIRCGHCKCDSRGVVHGDTSWLARRVGLRPPAGAGKPTPWVHSDVLALIARCGLGISPHEVELG